MKRRTGLFSILCLFLCLMPAGAAEWNFENDKNPDNGLVVTVGPYGIGWYPGHPVLGTAEGLWDMGRNGTMVVSVRTQSSRFACEVTYYNCIYTAPKIIVVDGAHIGEDIDELIEPETIEPPIDPEFGWRKLTSVWEVSSSVAVIVITADERWSALIDSVAVVQREPQLEEGDVNGDGRVNILDLICVRECYNMQDVEECSRADINTDGEVNVLDALFVRKRLAEIRDDNKP